MQRNLFALLVGINDYGGTISNLRGCVNDVEHWNAFLRDNVPLDRHIEILTDQNATRENIIHMFREHLCEAGENDLVLFHYSGHGSREMSAPVFKGYSPEGKDETLVCYDSRTGSGFDLADKELAMLLWEVSRKNPHIVVSLDCCHSGTGTRDKNDESNLAAVRHTRGRRFKSSPRPLASYMDGCYEQMERIRIPQSKHVLLAACDPTQLAWETKDHRGLFSVSMLETLSGSGPGITYADLFLRSRSAMEKYTSNQTPQLEMYLGALPYTRFLDGQSMAVIPGNEIHIGINMPQTPMPVLLEGEGEEVNAVIDSWREDNNFTFTNEPGACKYVLAVCRGRFLVSNRVTGKLIQGAEGTRRFCVDYVFTVLEKIVRWEQVLSLQNRDTFFNPEDVDLSLFEQKDNGSEIPHQSNSPTLSYIKKGEEWQPIRCELRVRHRTGRKLYICLLYLSRAFGIYPLKNERLGRGEDFVTLWGDGSTDCITLPEDADEVVDSFKLIVSTGKVDDFLLAQPGLEPGKVVVCDGPRGEPVDESKRRKAVADWFTRSLVVKTVRR